MGGLVRSARVRRLSMALATVSVFAVAGCTNGASEADPSSADRSPSSSPSPTKPAVPLTVAVSVPANAAKNVATGPDIAVATSGKVESVTLTSSEGKQIGGTLHTDGKTWTPATQLAFGTTYTVAVTAASGVERKTARSTFTTTSNEGGFNGADIYVTDGQTVGTGMPIVVEFVEDVPKALHAAIERRLFVSSTPKVEGSWYWFSNGEVHFRPKNYWPVGTKVSLRVAVGGVPMGNGTFGKRDRTATFTVGSQMISKVDNAAKVMTVYKDGVPVRRIKVSLGEPNNPTSFGTHVVMEKQEEAIFDSSTYGVPVNSPDGYRTKVYWAVRFTWGGEFTHAAPWSVQDQGVRNVSHGCINMSDEDAQWYFQNTNVGDIIQVIGTERQVAAGDGWTDWNIPWNSYLAGSALR